MAHRWDSGWVPIALAALSQDSQNLRRPRSARGLREAASSTRDLRVPATEPLSDETRFEGQTARPSARARTSRLPGLRPVGGPDRPVGIGVPTCDSACVRVDAARPDSRLGASRELAVWLAPAVGVALAQIAAQLVDFQLYDLHLRALNANSDASVVAWLTPVGMALALAGVLACLRRRDRARARRAVVATLLVGLLVVASARRGAFGGSLSLHRSTLMLAPALASCLRSCSVRRARSR